MTCAPGGISTPLTGLGILNITNCALLGSTNPSVTSLLDGLIVLVGAQFWALLISPLPGREAVEESVERALMSEEDTRPLPSPRTPWHNPYNNASEHRLRSRTPPRAAPDPLSRRSLLQ